MRHFVTLVVIYSLGAFVIGLPDLIGVPLSIIATIAIAIATKKPEEEPDSHGSARWANLKDLTSGDLVCRNKKSGHLLGHFGKTQICYNGDGSLITIARPGSGKGTSVIIPNLLKNRTSVVVFDPKGENLRKSVDVRNKFSKIAVFDPFNNSGYGSINFNPLACITEDDPESAVEDAAAIAGSCIVRSNEKDGFWDDKAQSFLRTFILYVCSREDRPKDLVTVYDYLTSDVEEFDQHIANMAVSNAFGGVVRRGANEIQRADHKERELVFSTILRNLTFLESPRVRVHLAASETSFDFGSLKTICSSVYLILPSKRLQTNRQLLRLWFSTAIRQLSKEVVESNETKAVLYIDEAAQLGPLPEIKTAITLLRGYGISTWTFWQSMSQLRDTFGEGGDVIYSSCAVAQFFGISDIDTAKKVSDSVGTTTIAVESESVNQKESHMTKSKSFTGRNLLMPDEVVRLPVDIALVFVQGMYPINAELKPYWEGQGEAPPRQKAS